MNIAIESHVLNHDRRSGLMTYTEGLVNGLYANDMENTYSLIYYSMTREANQMPGPSDRNFSRKVLRVPDQPFWGRQNILDGIMLPAYFLTSKIKVFHRVSGYTMPQVKGVFKVLTVHDLRTLTIGDNVWAQNNDDYRKVLNSLDACVVVSECTKKDLLKHFDISPSKVKVVYLGVDSRFKQLGEEHTQRLRDKYDIRGPFLLSVGSVPRKNIEGIIRSYAQSKAKQDFSLVLSCNLDIEKYRALAKELNVDHRIKILDKLSDEDVVALYSACFCFVFPSLYEGFGLPIVEAMTCGAPVLTANSSSCPEVAGDAAVCVDPNSIKDIAEGIDRICYNTAFRMDLITRGRERAKAFNWSTHAQEIKSIYAQAA